MADDIDELLDEVESKYIGSSKRSSQEQSEENIKECASSSNVTEELDAAIHSICSIPEPLGASPIIPSVTQLSEYSKRRCTVVYVGGNQVSSNGVSSSTTQRKGSRKPKSTSARVNSKRYFTKPVFELSVKDLEAESARRKQKELIETLFEKKLAVVTDKMVLDVRKFKRIKSDVWSNFGDVRLLISQSDAKKYNIEHHVICIGGEEMILCKSFVACVKCFAVFSYGSHAYGTSTLRSHLKSCGKPRYNMKEKKIQMVRQKRFYSDLISINTDGISEPNLQDDYKPPFQQKVAVFRDQANKLQEQILLFLLSKLQPFEILNNEEFKFLLQKFVQTGAMSGSADTTNFLCSKNYLSSTVLCQAYAACEAGFKKEVSGCYGVSFSSEVWMDSFSKLSYLSICCHYASDDDGILKSVIMFTSEFPYEEKMYEDFSQVFKQCLSFMKLDDICKLVVVDYSYNMVTAIEREYPFIQCICYSVSRAVQSVLNQLSLQENEEDPFALPGFASLINQCRNLVLHFKHHKLQGNLPKYLTFCASTCWKSTLGMLQSINNQWEHIADILNERGELDEIMSFDQEILSLVVDFLEIFRDSVEELSSLSKPTLNTVIPWLTKWKNHCLQNVDESPFLASLKSHMNSAIEEEVVTKITVFHKLATMLDPRFKMVFLSNADREEAKAQAILMVTECRNFFSKNNASNNPNGMSQSNDHFVDIYCTVTEEEGDDEWAATEEVENYLKELFVMGKLDLDSENKFNPLKYWVRTKSRYPYLNKIALWLLSCPASAVRCDEPVIASNWMLCPRECAFPVKDMHMCMFVRSYKKL